MAKTIVSLTAREEVPATYRVLDSRELVKKLNKASEITQKLQALLCQTYGEGGTSFRNMADHLQDAYMWQCADLADEIEGLVSESESMVSAAISE